MESAEGCGRGCGAFRSAVDWRTTDQEEVDRRRLRAVRERMRIRNLTPEHPVFSNFSVASASGQIYSVELRELKPLAASCTCPDFRVNGLGTCKHVEAVLRGLRADGATALRAAESAGSSRVDLVPDAATGRLTVERNLNRLPSALRDCFDVTGLALEECPSADIFATVEKFGGSGVRVSQDVAPWLARQARDAERIRLRRAYEQRVRAGLYPPSETRVPLLPYQREGMLHLAFTERALLADEFGLDKCAQAIAAVALLRRLGKVERVLVVSPRSTCPEWEAQIARLTTLPVRPVGDEKESRPDACASVPFFTVVDDEAFLRDIDAATTALRPDCLIVDAAQRVCNWNSRFAQAVKRFDARYLFLLAETPLDARINVLYSLLSLLDPHVLGPLFRFNREFYVLDESGRPVGYQNLPRLRERIRPYVLRRLKDDVRNELPDRTDRVVRMPMSTEQRERYAPVEARAVQRLAQAKGGAFPSSGVSELQRDLARMRMLCDTPYILDEDCRVCPKLDEIAALLDAALATPGEKVVVFSEWERMLALVRASCERLRIDAAWHTGAVPSAKRRQAIARFRSDPACRVLLSTDVGGVDLAFPQAGVVIQCDAPWSAERFERRIARVWRAGQVRNVTVVTVVTEDSVEARLCALLPELSTKTDGIGVAASDKNRAFLELAAAVLGGRVSEAPRPRVSAAALRAVDPELGFASVLAARLRGGLFACESRGTVDGRRVMLVAVEGDAEAVSAAAVDLRESWFDNRGADNPPEIEVVGRGTYETLARLVSCGVLTEPPSASGVRTLYRAGEGLALPRMEPGDTESRARQLAQRAREALRRARLLVGRLAFDEARRPLEEAVLCLACAHAVREGAPEPADWRQSVSERFRPLWGDIYEAVRELLAVDGSPVAVFRALGTKIADA